MPASDRLPGVRDRHVLLLRAALCDGREAVSAWESWSRAVRLERADAGSTRLLPLVYRNLLDQGAAESDLPGRLRGACRQAWSRVQSNLHAGVRAAEELGRHGVDTLVLKGAAMNLAAYRHAGTRPLNDVDLRVPREDAGRAMEILRAAGWRPRLSDPSGVVGFRHATGFLDAEDRRINLHWHFLLERCDDASDALLAAQPRPAAWQGVALMVPSASSLLLTACVYGPSTPARPALRWIADVGTLLRGSRGELQSAAVLEHARRLRVAVPVRAALEFLSSRLGIAPAAGLLEGLGAFPVDREDLLEYRVTSTSREVLGCLPALWFSYRRVRAGGADLSFARYVRCHFELPESHRLAAFVASAGARRLVGRVPGRP